MKQISISEFRMKCLFLVRQVEKTGNPVQITRYGKPVVNIVPVSPVRPRDWIGSMKGRFEILGDIVSPANDESDWEVLRD